MEVTSWHKVTVWDQRFLFICIDLHWQSSSLNKPQPFSSWYFTGQWPATTLICESSCYLYPGSSPVHPRPHSLRVSPLLCTRSIVPLHPVYQEEGKTSTLKLPMGGGGVRGKLRRNADGSGMADLHCLVSRRRLLYSQPVRNPVKTYTIQVSV